MVSKRRGVLLALIIGSIIGGTAGATILAASSASRSSLERHETAQRQAVARERDSDRAAINGAALRGYDLLSAASSAT
jgi:hypothetical protein